MYTAFWSEKLERYETFRRPRHRREYNTKINLNERGCDEYHLLGDDAVWLL
jgi:hypothetical protein